MCCRSRSRVSAGDLREEAVLASLPEFAGVGSLRVEYDGRTLRWLLERVEQKTSGGRLQKALIRNEEKIVGWYLYHLNRGGIADVLQIAATPSSVHDVLDHLFYQAWRQGAIAVTGRLEPRFLQALSDKYCLFHRRGPWMLVSAKQPRLVQSFLNGHGERGGEVPRLRSGARLYRALVAGGSQPEGYLLDQDTSWPGALQRLLQTPEHLQRLGASEVHVGSIARSGAGSEAVDVILARLLPRYPRLQAIIILVGVSDVFRWLAHGAPPSPPPQVRTSALFMCHPAGPFGWKPRELALVELLLRMRRLWLRPVHVHERGGKWVGNARVMRAQAKEIRATMPDPAPMLDHFGVHLRMVLQKAKAHADRVLVARQPWFAED